MTENATKPSPLNTFLQTGTFVLACIGVVGGYFKFSVIDHRLAPYDERIKAADAQKVETPTLEVTPSLSSSHGFDSDYRLKYATIHLLLNNVGTAPVQVGAITLQVEEGSPEIELLKKLQNQEGSRELPRPPLISDEPVESLMPSAMMRPVLDDDSAGKSTNLDTASKGIYSVSHQDIPWTPKPELTRNYEIDYVLPSGVKRSISFDYILENSSVPKWYRVLIELSPPLENPEWKKIRVVSVLDIGPFPVRPPNFIPNVVTTLSRTLEIVPPIPSNAFRQVAPPPVRD